MAELKRSWAVALSLVSFFSTPVFAVLAVTGQDFVVLLLGQNWAPAGPILCILAVRGIAQSIERTLGWLHVFQLDDRIAGCAGASSAPPASLRRYLRAFPSELLES